MGNSGRGGGHNHNGQRPVPTAMRFGQFLGEHYSKDSHNRRSTAPFGLILSVTVLSQPDRHRKIINTVQESLEDLEPDAEQKGMTHAQPPNYIYIIMLSCLVFIS